MDALIYLLGVASSGILVALSTALVMCKVYSEQ